MGGRAATGANPFRSGDKVRRGGAAMRHGGKAQGRDDRLSAAFRLEARQTRAPTAK